MDEKEKQLNDKLLKAVAEPHSTYHASAPCKLQPGRKIELEFYCQMCSHYIYFKLNTGIEGNHVINCPMCGHKHYRFVYKGVITGDRWDGTGALADEITPMKSAASKEPRQRSQMAVIREMEAVGLLK